MGGTKLINESITYSDTEGNIVSFPAPTVAVGCDVVVHPEECPLPVELSVDGCEDAVTMDMGDAYLESQGRIIHQKCVSGQAGCAGGNPYRSR